MRRSVEILESRLTALYQYRDMMQHAVASALSSSAPPEAMAKVRENGAKWERRWTRVHDKAMALWTEAGGLES